MPPMRKIPPATLKTSIFRYEVNSYKTDPTRLSTKKHSIASMTRENSTSSRNILAADISLLESLFSKLKEQNRRKIPKQMNTPSLVRAKVSVIPAIASWRSLDPFLNKFA